MSVSVEKIRSVPRCGPVVTAVRAVKPRRDKARPFVVTASVGKVAFVHLARQARLWCTALQVPTSSQENISVRTLCEVKLQFTHPEILPTDSL